ncbi:MAG TPA: ABC transporter substrate-binding protein [Opitutaceae bacterium]|nr:ABC transporter substrate-binding protein [Opitutaceae bacterium]
MLRSLKHLWLGLALIAAASGILLCSDLGRRQKKPQAPAHLPRVALFQFTSTALLDDSTKGVVEGLAEAGFVEGKTIELVRFNASGDYATATAIAKDLAAGGYDQIVTISTPALQVMASANRDGKTPHVFGTVTDPYGSGVGITGPAPDQHPAHLVGIGTFQPVTNIFRIARQMNPKLRRVGAVWNPTEHNSEACVLKARAICSELGIELVEANAGNTSEVPEAFRSVLARDVEAVWIGGDTVVNSSAGSIISIAKAAGVPVFTNDPTDTARGALFSLGASYPDVGRTIGALSAKLLRGTDPRTIGVENVVPELLTLNRDVLAAFSSHWTATPEHLARAQGPTTSPAKAQAQAQPEPGRTYKINLVYMTPHKLFDEAIIGARKALAEKGFIEGKNLQLSISHANGDMSMMQQIALNVSATDADLIMSLSTPALACVAGRVKDKPVVFAEVTEPVGAGAGKSFTDHQPNVTGAVAPAPLEGGFTWLLKLYPHIKKIGMIYTPSEPNVMTEVRITEEFAKKYGFELVRRAANNPSEVAEALTAVFAEGIDAFFLEGDNSIMAASSLVVSTCRKHGVPLLADDESGMGNGALLACGVSPEGNGHFGGLIAARVLLGENPAAIPFTPSTAADLSLDFAAAQQLNFTFPQEILLEANIFHHVATRFGGRPARIALVSLVQAHDLELAEKGLLHGLDQSGLVEGTDFVLQRYNAQGEIAQLPQLFDAALATQPDLIVTITTPALVAGVHKVKSVPLVFTVSSDPEKLGLFEKGKPGNLTGVHDDPPMDKLLAMAAAHHPGLSAIGTVFNPAEPNSVISVEKLRAVCRTQHIVLHEATVTNVSDLSLATQSLVQRGAQAILTSADNLVGAGFPVLARTARDAGVPVFTSEPAQVEQGATGAVGDDYEEWGAQSGRLAAKVLAGVPPAELPIEPTAVQRTIAPEPTVPAARAATAKPAKAPTPPAKPWQLRIVAYNETTLSEECLQGLKDGLVRGGLVEGRDFVLKTLNAQGDMSTLSSIMSAVRSDQPDLLMAITTPALQAALRQAGNVRIVFTGVADGVQAGAGKSETDHLPNVTGITTRSPFEGMAALIRELLPNARRVGTLFTPAEVNSLVYKQGFEQALKPLGLELVCVPVTATAETAESTAALCRENIDLVCQISDNTTRPAFGQIARKVSDAGLPIFAFDTNQVKAGAILALARDYYDAGLEAGELAVRILHGESPAGIPFANTRSEKLTVNPAAAAKVGLLLPESLLQRATVLPEAAHKP